MLKIIHLESYARIWTHHFLIIGLLLLPLDMWHIFWKLYDSKKYF